MRLENRLYASRMTDLERNSTDMKSSPSLKSTSPAATGPLRNASVMGDVAVGISDRAELSDQREMTLDERSDEAARSQVP